MAKEFVKIELTGVQQVESFTIGDNEVKKDDMKLNADGTLSNSVWVPSEALTTVGNEFIVNRVFEYPVTLSNGQQRMATAVGVVMGEGSKTEKLISSNHFRSFAAPTLKQGQVIVVADVETRQVPERTAKGKIKKDPTTKETIMADKKYAKFELKVAA